MSPIQVNDIYISIPQLEIQELQAEPSHIHFVIMPSVQEVFTFPKSVVMSIFFKILRWEAGPKFE